MIINEAVIRSFELHLIRDLVIAIITIGITAFTVGLIYVLLPKGIK